jgi:energy-coupling factor transport system permease protein
MLRNISLGTYHEGESLLHRLQARTKFLALVGIAIWLMIANQRQWHFAPVLSAVALLVTAIALSGIPVRLFWHRIWILVVFTLIGSVPALFTRENGNKALYPLGPIFTTYGFVQQTLFIGSIVIAGILLSSFLPLSGIRTLWRQRWIKFLRLPLFMLLVIALIVLWFIAPTSAATHFPIGPFIITYEGVWLVADVFPSLLLLFTFSLLVTMSTTPVALIEGLTMLLAPLRRLRLPVDDFALMALLALRFVPTLTEEVEQLMKAQTARGAALTDGPIRERLQSLAMFFVPLIQSILRRASELATALEARGYEVEGKQTMLYETSFALADYVVMGLLGALIVGTLMI